MVHVAVQNAVRKKEFESLPVPAFAALECSADAYWD
jgi:hypothetical protein